MAGLSRRMARRLAIWIAATAAAGAAGALLLAASGVVNIAASTGHSAVEAWFLQLGMRRSVSFHAGFVGAPPDLDDPDLVRLGAAHYHGECAICHGGPGLAPKATVLSMTPHPPEFPEELSDWSNTELFWIVRHGVRYTAMPAWPAPERADEIWAAAAFLRVLPALSEADYRDLVSSAEDIGRAPESVVVEGRPGPAPALCARCHDAPGEAPKSALAPRLAGQPEAYLKRAMLEYKAGTRPSGFMQAVASALDEEEIDALAAYYARLAPALLPDRPFDADAVARGRELARNGAPRAGLPMCAACHEAPAADIFPQLAGLDARYIEGQLRLWKKGGRAMTPTGRIMATIAGRLTEAQIEDVAAYYASLPPDRAQAGLHEDASVAGE